MQKTMIIWMSFVVLAIGFACVGCGGGSSIAGKLEANLKAEGYVIMTDEQSYALTRAMMDFTIEDGRTGEKRNFANVVKGEDFKGSFCALDGATPKAGVGRKVCLRFCPKGANTQGGSILILPLDQDAKKTLRAALLKIDPQVCNFLCSSVDQYSVTHNLTFETSDVRMVIDEKRGHGLGLLAMKPPVLRIEFKK